MQFQTPRAEGGRNHKNCNFAQTRDTAVLPFGEHVLVGIFEGILSLPRSRAHISYLGRLDTPMVSPSSPARYVQFYHSGQYSYALYVISRYMSGRLYY